jgi:integrase
LLAAARQLGPTTGMRGVVYETLFGLIASTGLRLSEALDAAQCRRRSQGRDADHPPTKFGKSRQVPCTRAPSKPCALSLDARLAEVAQATMTPFFVGTRGRRSGQAAGDRQVHRVFAELRQQLGWRNRGTHHAPRIHDLRHTFVVRRIVQWQAQGVDIDQAMLSLSTYVGHAMVTNTYWYLSAVPELMALAARRFESFMPEPQVRHA